MSLMLADPSAIAAAIETIAIPRSRFGEVRFSFSVPDRAAMSRLVGGLAEQDRADVAHESVRHAS